MPNPATIDEAIAYFWKHVPTTDKSQCWIWTGREFGSGYPLLPIAGGKLGAHRFSYELHYGCFSIFKQICHTCDTPMCVNPAHLFAGTHLENQQDKVKKGRHAASLEAMRSSLPYKRKTRLTPEAVREIRSSSASLGALAKKFSVAPNAIRQARLYQTHRGI